MKGHGQKLTRKQSQAIAALLNCASIADAAESVGVHANTLQNWLKVPTFRDSYFAARYAIVESTVNRLVSLTGAAVETLQKNLKSKNPAVANRAADLILDHAATGLQIHDFATRLAELKQMIEENAKAPRYHYAPPIPIQHNPEPELAGDGEHGPTAATANGELDDLDPLFPDPSRNGISH